MLSYNNTQVSVPMSIQVCILPQEYNNVERTKVLIEDDLNIAKVSSIRIIQKTIYNRKLQKSVNIQKAFIEIDTWNETVESIRVQNELRLLQETKFQAQNSYTISLGENLNITWENGEPMTHISVRDAKPGSGIVPEENTNTTKVEENNPCLLDLQEDDWNSLYIPIIPQAMYLSKPDNTLSVFQPNQLSSFIENELKLGRVSRVDFVDRILDDGRNTKGAFVHFENWNNNSQVNEIRNTLDSEGQYRIKGYYDGKTMRSLIVRNDNGDKVNGYFVLKINHKPIQEAPIETNVSQLLAANKILEEKNKEKDETIKQLQEKLEILESISNRLGLSNDFQVFKKETTLFLKALE